MTRATFTSVVPKIAHRLAQTSSSCDWVEKSNKTHAVFVWVVMQEVNGMDTVGRGSPTKKRTLSIVVEQVLLSTYRTTMRDKPSRKMYQTLTSEIISYTVYRLRMNPCCPKIFTLT